VNWQQQQSSSKATAAAAAAAAAARRGGSGQYELALEAPASSVLVAVQVRGSTAAQAREHQRSRQLDVARW